MSLIAANFKAAKQVSAALKKCIEVVDRDVTLLVGLADDSEDAIAEKIRSCNCISKASDKKEL